jgi:hypothetical protein
MPKVPSGEAQNKKSSAMSEIVSFASRPQSDYTADFRTSFAQTLANFCQEVLDALPTNTPAEDAWVTSEGKTKDAAKFIRLLKSKEYNRSFLKTTFSECKDTTLVEMIQQLPRGTETFSRLEAAQFVKLAQLLDVSVESYASNVEASKDVKAAIDDIHLQFVRHGLFKATREALQDVH